MQSPRSESPGSASAERPEPPLAADEDDAREPFATPPDGEDDLNEKEDEDAREPFAAPDEDEDDDAPQPFAPPPEEPYDAPQPLAPPPYDEEEEDAQEPFAQEPYENEEEDEEDYDDEQDAADEFERVAREELDDPSFGALAAILEGRDAAALEAYLQIAPRQLQDAYRRCRAAANAPLPGDAARLDAIDAWREEAERRLAPEAYAAVIDALRDRGLSARALRSEQALGLLAALGVAAPTPVGAFQGTPRAPPPGTRSAAVISGRPPKGKRWDTATGAWVQTQGPKPRAAPGGVREGVVVDAAAEAFGEAFARGRAKVNFRGTVVERGTTDGLERHWQQITEKPGEDRRRRGGDDDEWVEGSKPKKRRGGDARRRQEEADAALARRLQAEEPRRDGRGRRAGHD